MLIYAIPVSGALVVNLRVEADALTINGTTWRFEDLPSDGPVRLEFDQVVVEYGEHGGVGTCCLTDAHVVEVMLPNLPPPPPPAVNAEAVALAELEAQRGTWVAQRWQMIAVLGPDRWQAILDFGDSPLSTWGMKAAIDCAVDIPRNSQTVDLLAYILGLSEEETDQLFRQAMSLVA